jgi:hypothetical protein
LSAYKSYAIFFKKSNVKLLNSVDCSILHICPHFAISFISPSIREFAVLCAAFIKKISSLPDMIKILFLISVIALKGQI